MKNFFSKVKAALGKTSSKISTGLEEIFIKKKLDAEALQNIEDLLISADVGFNAASLIASELKKKKFNKDFEPSEIRLEIANIIAQNIEENIKHNLNLKDIDKDNNSGLKVILVCGVNGNGKTTSIGKLAHYYKNKGLKVALSACDTYRAAAIEQLKIWARRADVTFYSGAEKADPASVAHISVSKAMEEGVDILFIDTAGRLHNQKNLMEELAKIKRVIGKQLEHAPQYSLLVVDGTTGQNALMQLEYFSTVASINGLIITKLDGTAKAGILIAMVNKFKIDVPFIGIGEQIDDLKEFDATIYAKALVNCQE